VVGERGGSTSGAAWLNLGSSYQEKGRAADAKSCFQRVLSPDLTSDPYVKMKALVNLSFLLLDEVAAMSEGQRRLWGWERLVDVEKLAAQACALAPVDWFARYALGLAQLRQAQFLWLVSGLPNRQKAEGARDVLRSALTLQPATPEVVYALGECEQLLRELPSPR
jgi:tetratricopeptide (TPR) repeat protein